MPLLYRFNRLGALLMLVICVTAVAVAWGQTEPASQVVTARIKLDDLSMILVPVRINGSDSYDFLLDTGCSKTIVDQKLADQLGLPRVGEKTMVGVLAPAEMSVVRIDSLSVAGITAVGGEIFSSDRPATVTGKVRGVSGVGPRGELLVQEKTRSQYL